MRTKFENILYENRIEQKELLQVLLDVTRNEVLSTGVDLGEPNIGNVSHLAARDA